MKTAYNFCFQTRYGKAAGPLAIQHAPTGGVILAMGQNVTGLTLRQLYQLNFKPEELIAYNPKIFDQHFDLSDKAKDRINEIVTQDIDEVLDTIFIDLHTKFATLSGDITPEQVYELHSITTELKILKARLTHLVTNQIWQNK